MLLLATYTSQQEPLRHNLYTTMLILWPIQVLYLLTVQALQCQVRQKLANIPEQYLDVDKGAPWSSATGITVHCFRAPCQNNAQKIYAYCVFAGSPGLLNSQGVWFTTLISLTGNGDCTWVSKSQHHKRLPQADTAEYC